MTDFEYNSQDISTLIHDDQGALQTVPSMFKIAYHYASRGLYTFIATKYNQDFEYLNRDPYKSNPDHLRNITLRYFKTAEEITSWCSDLHYSHARKPQVLILHCLEDYVPLTIIEPDCESNDSQKDMFDEDYSHILDGIMKSVSHMEVCGALCEVAVYLSNWHKSPVPLYVISRTCENLDVLPFKVFFRHFLTHEQALSRF